MTSIPRDLRWLLPVGLLLLAITGWISPPDGTGMQWDELVLAAFAIRAAWLVLRRTRSMEQRVSRPWLVVGVGAILFTVSQLLSGLFPGPAFDGFGIDDVILFVGASSPVLTCAMLARQVSRTRWTALLLDGGAVTAALLVVTEILRAPVVDHANAPADLRSLVLMYGAYSAVMLGGAGALCTVSTAGLRRSATIMIFAVAWQAAAAFAQGLAIVVHSPLWNVVSDVSVAMGLQTTVLAALVAPVHDGSTTGRAGAPKVSRTGMGLVVVSLLSVPVGMVWSLVAGRPLSTLAELGCAVVFALVAFRVVLRIREDGRMAEDLVRSEEDFRSLVESSSDGVAIVDRYLHLLFASPAARIMLGLHADASAADIDLIGRLEPEDRAPVRTALKRGGVPVLHFRVRLDDGRSRELEATSTDRPGSDKRVLYLRDVTSRRRRERELERMAYTDHLTGLPNRAQLFDDLATATAEGGHCLLVLDLDGFKAVNDIAGHETGDNLLVEVARRLNTIIRGDDLVSRLGGDEFAVLVAGTLEESVEVAQRIVDTLALPYRFGERTFPMGASVGVAPLQAGGGQVAFRAADTALRSAKQAGKGCVRVAEGDPAAATDGDHDLATALADGSAHLRFDAAMEPDGRMPLVHAVPVWTHPVLGTVRGSELWTTAERQGRTRELLRWLLHHACAEACALGDALTVAVSLAPGAAHPAGVATAVAEALAATGLPASRLMLSLTEETLLTSPAALVRELEAVRASGVQLCLDNYGMGHALFPLLQRIMLDAVRVDVAAFTANGSPLALQMLAAIVKTSNDFGVTVIAGGIRTPQLRESAVWAGVHLLHGRELPHDMSAADVALALTAATHA